MYIYCSKIEQNFFLHYIKAILNLSSATVYYLIDSSTGGKVGEPIEMQEKSIYVFT